MTTAWIGNYSSEAIDNTMRGRTGMTKIYDIADGPPDYSYSIDIPFDFEIARARKPDKIWISPTYLFSAGYNLFTKYTGYYDQSIDTKFEINWKKETDTDTYTDGRYTQTNWTGYALEGVTPNRTLTWRAEFQCLDLSQPYPWPPTPDEKVMEVVFYENDKERLDIRFSSSLNEPLQTIFYMKDSIFADYPYVPENGVGQNYAYLKYTGTDNEGRRYNLRDTWSTTGSGGGGGGGSPTTGTGEAFDYKRVWNSPDLATSATTTGLVAIHYPTNNYTYITNIQDVKNTRLVPKKFKVGEQLYSNTGPANTYQSMDQVIYLDTAKGGNGYGFTANQLVFQMLPDGSTVSGKVVSENVSPPLIYVTESNAKFQKYPISNGTVKANVVGSLSPQIKGEVVYFMPLYIIDRNGEWTYINLDEYGNYTFGEPINSYDGEILILDPNQSANVTTNAVDELYLVANYNDTQNLIPRGNIKDRWTLSTKDYEGLAIHYNDPNDYRSYLIGLYTTGTYQGDYNSYYGGYFTIYDQGTTEIGQQDGNWDDRDTHRSNKAFMVYNNNDLLLQLGGNTSSIYKTLYTRAAVGEGSEPYRIESDSTNTCSVWTEWSTIFSFNQSGQQVDTLKLIKPDDAPYDTEGQQDPDKVWVFPITLHLTEAVCFTRNAWASANVVWPGGAPPMESDMHHKRIFHLININDPKDKANNHIWYGFNATGEQLFPWYRNNRAHTLTLTYSWTSAGGTDLDTRTWITIPSGRYDGDNNILGWGYNDPSVRMGLKPNPNSNSYMTFSGDDTSSGGTETIVIPIDTIAYAHDELRTKTTLFDGNTHYDSIQSYIDIHCGAYWYYIRNSGNFSFKVRNDVTGYEYTDTINVQHRNQVGIGPNEFAVFRLHLDYLRLERIS